MNSDTRSASLFVAIAFLLVVAASVHAGAGVALLWLWRAIGSSILPRAWAGIPTWAPLGVFGLIRWSVWVSRKIPALLYRPITAPYTTSASIIVPVYQEDPEIFQLALECWRLNRPDELIAVIDATDEVCIHIARAYPDVQIIVTDVPGKRAALAQGIRAATSEIVVLSDSDTIWTHGTLEKILRPFADPKIGGVGTRQQVWRPRSFWQRIAQIGLSVRYDLEAPALTRFGRAVSCLSGRTAAYRRRVLLPLLDDFTDEYFLGKLCMSGDDKRLTSLVLRAGYDTYYQGDALVLSTFPADFRTFVRQRVRWTRNTYRSDLRAIWEGWVWKHGFLAFMLVDRLFAPYAQLIGLGYFAFALATQQLIVAGVLAAWWLSSRSLKVFPHLRRNPADLLIVPHFVALTFLMAGLKVYALVTVHHHKWLTRQVQVVDGEVVREAAARRDHTPVVMRLAGIAMAAAFFLVVQAAFTALGDI